MKARLSDFFFINQIFW